MKNRQREADKNGQMKESARTKEECICQRKATMIRLFLSTMDVPILAQRF